MWFLDYQKMHLNTLHTVYNNVLLEGERNTFVKVTKLDACIIMAKRLLAYLSYKWNNTQSIDIYILIRTQCLNAVLSVQIIRHKTDVHNYL